MPHARRPAAPKRVAFVLSGGGSLGAIQVGQLRALAEAGVVPDVLIGCSVGALNAAFLAIGPSADRVGELQQLWLELRDRDVFGGRRTKLVNIARRADHLCEPDGLVDIIRRWLPVRDISETAIPLHVVTTNLNLGEPVWHTAGAPEVVLVASACLPGVFPPVTIDGEPHVDGGITDAVPVDRAAELGVDEIWVLDVDAPFSARGVTPIRALDVLLLSFAISRRAHTRDQMQRSSAGRHVHLLPKVDTGLTNIQDFTHTAALIEAGYASAATYLAEHLNLAPSVPGGRVLARLRRAGRLQLHRPRRPGSS